MLALAWLQLAPSAAGQTPRGRIEATGVVAFNSLANGPFVGIPAGTAVQMQVDITLPGAALAPGQYENYAINTATSSLKVGASVLTFQPGGEPIGLQNNFPVADGVHLFATPMSPSYSMEFELFDGTGGGVFASPDYETEAGFYGPALFQAIDWNVLGAGQMGITLQQLTVHPVSTFGTWLLDGPGTPGHLGKTPFLSGQGGIQTSDFLVMPLTDAKPSVPIYFIIGVASIHAPFKGGVMVPRPDLIFLGMTTDVNGGTMAIALWPAIPHGLSLWFQMWMPDPAGPAGFAASNGVRGITF